MGRFLLLVSLVLFAFVTLCALVWTSALNLRELLGLTALGLALWAAKELGV